MKYFGLILIPLVLVLFLGGPGCSQSQDEPAVKMEQAPEKAVEVPAVEEVEEVVVEVDEMGDVAEVDEMGDVAEVDEIDVEVDVPAEAEKTGKGLMDQVKDKAEEEAGEQIDQVEIEEIELK